MPDQTTKTDVPDGPSLHECQALIARIDGTMEALRHERERLEQRAGRLAASRLAPAEPAHGR